MSASFACVICRFAEHGAEHPPRASARASASSSARRARPSAAAPTLGRKMSSVAIATLNPSPGAPSRCVVRHHAVLEPQDGASGCGAIVSMRAATRRPGVFASTKNADSPRAPGASPLRANTT